MADKITYNITRHLAVLSTSEKSGWTTEANIVSWNNGPEKLDIRAWNPEHTKMAKGLTLTEKEAKRLALALGDLFRQQGEAHENTQ